MPTWDERSVDVQGSLVNAEAQVAGLGGDIPSTSEAADGLRRLQAALDSARSRLGGTDDLRVSETMLVDLTNKLDQLSGSIAQQRQNILNGLTFDWTALSADPVLDALAKWPEPLPRGMAAAIRRQVEDMPNLLAARLNELEERQRELADKWNREFSEFSDTAEEWSLGVNSDVERLKSEVTTQETTLTTQSARVEEALRNWDAVFTGSQAAHNATFTETMKGVEGGLEEHLTLSKARVDEAEGAIYDMREQAAKLLGAIGRDGMSVGYQRYSNAEADAANHWRLFAVTLGIASVGVLALMVYFITRIQHPTAGDYTGRYALAVLLAGVAGYAARQSGEHRKRAAEARNSELALSSLGPYLEPLPEPMQHELLAALTTRFFAQTEAVNSQPESDSDKISGSETGPGLFGLIQQIVGKQRT